MSSSQSGSPQALSVGMYVCHTHATYTQCVHTASLYAHVNARWTCNPAMGLNYAYTSYSAPTKP